MLLVNGRGKGRFAAVGPLGVVLAPILSTWLAWTVLEWAWSKPRIGSRSLGRLRTGMSPGVSDPKLRPDPKTRPSGRAAELSPCWPLMGTSLLDLSKSCDGLLLGFAEGSGSWVGSRRWTLDSIDRLATTLKDLWRRFGSGGPSSSSAESS